jgi:sugar-specific transcriptional regulator TrmB
LLDIGRAHIGGITEKTRMHRRTVYDCLERLKDRGLVTFIVEGKTRFFTAVNPNKLLSILQEKEANIKEILPKLFELAGKLKQKIEVSVHAGKEGLKNIMEDIIRTSPQTWYSLTSASKGLETLPFYIPHFHDRRIAKHIVLQIIVGKSRPAIKRGEQLKKLKLTNVKSIDTKYVIPISIWIYNNKTAFMLWESRIGILIESEETANTFRNYFEVLWKDSS